MNKWSHFILGGLNYYVLTSKISTMYLMCSYCIAKHFCCYRGGIGVRDRFGGVGRFKGGLRCKGWVNSVIINVITEINYRCKL